MNIEFYEVYRPEVKFINSKFLIVEVGSDHIVVEATVHESEHAALSYTIFNVHKVFTDKYELNIVAELLESTHVLKSCAFDTLREAFEDLEYEFLNQQEELDKKQREYRKNYNKYFMKTVEVSSQGVNSIDLKELNDFSGCTFTLELHYDVCQPIEFNEAYCVIWVDNILYIAYCGLTKVGSECEIIAVYSIEHYGTDFTFANALSRANAIVNTKVPDHHVFDTYDDAIKYCDKVLLGDK